ncbi:MAG: peptidase C26 [Planctomycetes bacterium]|jgi:putative glutamine amidotransferase|nr:peptidase C26 [Planctomycetota bacterium]MDP6424950.1 gamma-glutamyl-gamma-aminobutyrate hydrolase family protein [Planctomycetota bacterium]
MSDEPRLRVAASVSLEPPSADRELFKNKPLQYLEESMILACAEAGAMPYLVPDLKDPASAVELLDGFDGLLLTGGTDVAPSAYGEEPLRPEWAGDAPRDAYELALLRAALERRIPVLGICRGCQIINVGFGGSLWQDVATQVDGALPHRDHDAYDSLTHGLLVDGDSRLGAILGPSFRVTSQVVNSVHHQAVREVGADLRAVARAPDGVIEAIEHVDRECFVLGVQWHPEWRETPDPVMTAFVSAVRDSSRTARGRSSCP